MLYHCAPEPEDVLAQRRLSDGRELAVFVQRVTEQTVTGGWKEIRHIAGEVIVRMRVTTTAMSSRSIITGYALVITTDTKMPERWRTIDTRRQRSAILRLFEKFQEGDDERRQAQADDSPRRRIGERETES